MHIDNEIPASITIEGAEFGGRKSPSSKARTTAWVRSETPSLAIMSCTCTLAVALLMVRPLAMSRFVFPCASSLSTSSSRDVSLFRRAVIAAASLVFTGWQHGGG